MFRSLWPLNCLHYNAMFAMEKALKISSTLFNNQTLPAPAKRAENQT